MSYGFRCAKWQVRRCLLDGRAQPSGNSFPPLFANLSMRRRTGHHSSRAGYVVSGEMRAVQWKPGTTDTLEASPVKDSIMAVTDEGYFDWPVLPEAPSSLDVTLVGDAARLTWQVHGGNTTGIVVERQKEGVGAHKVAWERIANLGAATTESPIRL